MSVHTKKSAQSVQPFGRLYAQTSECLVLLYRYFVDFPYDYCKNKNTQSAVKIKKPWNRMTNYRFKIYDIKNRPIHMKRCNFEL